LLVAVDVFTVALQPRDKDRAASRFEDIENRADPRMSDDHVGLADGRAQLPCWKLSAYATRKSRAGVRTDLPQHIHVRREDLGDPPDVDVLWRKGNSRVPRVTTTRRMGIASLITGSNPSNTDPP
jgi:hypothetical protein